MRGPRSSLAVLSLLLSGTAAGEGPPAPPRLEDLVDLPDPAQRLAAARALAAGPAAAVPLPDLLAAARSFGKFDDLRRGPGAATVPLWNGKETEPVEVAFYAPPDYDPASAAPLLLVLHGTGGNGRDAVKGWKATADVLAMVVVAPTDPGGAGYGFTERERTLALSALRWARRRFDVDENRVFATGASRGGHLAWDLALRHPDLFAALAPMLGAPRLSLAGGGNNLRFIENVLHLPIRDLQGAKDDPLLLDNLHMAFERLQAGKARDAQLIQFPSLGHEVDMGAVEWKEFFRGPPRDPRAPAVLRRCVAPAEGRAFWAEVTKVGKGVEEVFRLTVDAEKWKAMDQASQRRTFGEEAEKRTARLEVRMRGPGRFEATGAGVDRFRLLLEEGMFVVDRPVEVLFNGKTYRKGPVPDRRVLLEEFAERFDRTFLPVVEISVP